jgi:hypothetical protein
MSTSNLFNKNCFSKLTEEQKTSVERLGVESSVVDNSCSRETNSCGKSLQELVDQYSFYDPQKGTYTSWGNIEFPWDIDSSTVFNLNYAESDNKWRVAKYQTQFSYFTGDKVLYIEDDGYKISLYEANQDIDSAVGIFEESKWDRVCQIELSKPFTLPTPEELNELYSFYSLEFFLTKWGDFSNNWSFNLENDSSDQWGDAKIRKDFFYSRGEYILVEGYCKDTLCLFLAHTDMPATDENYEIYKNFLDSPWENYFQKVYCVKTKINKCLEREKTRDLPNYKEIKIGSQGSGDYLEKPLPYYDLKGNFICSEDNIETLNAKSIGLSRKVLSQEEIDSL